MRFFIQLLTMITLALFSAVAFSHAGSHENKNCFISMGNNTLRLTSYQFQGLHPDEAFCHILPYLGSVIIKIEPVNQALSHQKVALELLKPKSWLNCTSINSSNALLIKQTPLQKLNKGVNMLQTEIQERGIYVLNIQLQREDQKIVTQRFFFLVGIPVTKLLVLFSISLLGILALFAAVKNRRKKRLANV
jgi:hypothetical protein